MAGLFDKLYNASDELKAKLKKPVVAKKVKGKLRSALNSANEKIIDLQIKREEVLGQFDDFDVNAILDLDVEANHYEDDIVAIKALYKELFAEELKED